MKVCLAHGGDVSQPSGGTDRVTALASGLRQRGVGVTLVVPSPSARLPERLSDVDVKPVRTGRFGLENPVTRALSVTGKARAIASEQNAYLQLEHSSLAGIGTLRGCEGYILDMHDVAFPRFDHTESLLSPAMKRGVRWLEHRAVSRSHHIVAVSERMAEVLRREWSVPDDRVSIIPNGFFPSRIRDCREVQPVDGRVCFLGTLHPKVDVNAFQEITRLEAVDELVIIGDGALRDRVKKLTKRNETVQAPGRLPDAEAFELLASAEVVINPQTSSDLQRSSSPVKLFYYAALGKPMVITKGPSVVQELVEVGAARAAESREEFIKELSFVLNSTELQEELSRNARKAASSFQWEQRTSQLKEVYDSLDMVAET